MKTEESDTKFLNLKFLLVLPAISLLLFIFPSNTNGQEPAATQEPFVAVEEMPMFPGGDIALQKYIYANVKYPRVSQENNVQGKVIIRFCINADGSIDRISVVKPVDPLLDAEAIKVVKSLPTFKPGKKNGVAVPVWYMVPISFKMRVE